MSSPLVVPRRHQVMIPILVLILVMTPGLWANDAPLLPVQVTGIDATTNRTVDCVLPAGVAVSGTVTSDGGNLIIGGSVTARSADVTFEGAIQFSPVAQSSRYQITLPPGRYRLKVRALFVVEETGTTLTVTYPESDEIAITATMVHDLRIPPPPPVVRVRGVVQNLGGLDAEDAVIFFAREDGTIQASAPLAEDFMLAVPVGRYVIAALGLRPPLSDDLSELLNLELATVTISGVTTVDVTIPPLVEVKGTITMTRGNAGFPMQIAVASVDQQATRAAVTVPTDATEGQYSLLVPAGFYDAIAFVPISLEEDAGGVLGFPVSSRRFRAESGAELHFTIPPIGPVVTLSGRVTDAQGNPVGGVFVLASSGVLTDMTDVFFTAATLSENDGTYELKVISGRNYSLLCTPPAM